MTFIIDIELYDCRVHILNGLSDTEFQKYIIENSDITEIERKKATAACWTVWSNEGKPEYFIDFKKRLKKDKYSFNTIGHESAHATFEIMKRVNINYVYDITDEAYCCLNGFITGKIYEGVYL